MTKITQYYVNQKVDKLNIKYMFYTDTISKYKNEGITVHTHYHTV